MPRTKRPAAPRKVERALDPEEAARRQYLEDVVKAHKNQMDMRCEMEIKNILMSFKILQNLLGEGAMKKTIGQMKSELVLREVHKMNDTTAPGRPPSHDDETSAHGSGERGTHRPRASRSATRHAERSDVSAQSATTKRRRTRSVEQPQTQPRRAARPTRPPSAFKPPASVYKTPAYKDPHNNFPVITPKATPNAPLTVLRRPRQGEMVVSMSGSPLMVPTMNSETRANCNIPLFDGTMLSLQPEHLRKSSTFIPLSLMDKETLRQLKTLKDNLDTVVRLGERGGKV